jgi:hypothetical protein
MWKNASLGLFDFFCIVCNGLSWLCGLVCHHWSLATFARACEHSKLSA